MTHRHLSQDELLDRLLGWSPAGLELRSACALCASAEDELAAFLARSRDSRSASSVEGLPETALVARILARTTREDLGWRGDLGVLAGFVRQRLSASRALRLLAASLAVHLLVLPLCAWLALRPEPAERALRVRLEPPVPSLPDVPEEPLRALEPLFPPEPEAVELDPFAIQRRLERVTLERTPFPAAGDLATGPAGVPVGVPRGVTGRLLALRAARDAELVRAGAPDVATPLERALWVEVLIDHLVLSGERLPALEVELERVGADLGQSPVVLWVEALVLERAWELGLLEAPLEARYRALEAVLGERLPAVDLRRPLGSRGFGRALAAALGPAAGVWAAWDR